MSTQRRRPGYRPLHQAAVAGREDLVRLLLDAGADRDGALRSRQDACGVCPRAWTRISGGDAGLTHYLSAISCRILPRRAWLAYLSPMRRRSRSPLASIPNAPFGLSTQFCGMA